MNFLTTPDRTNIETILDYLSKQTDVPEEIILALTNLLERAEQAEMKQAQGADSLQGDRDLVRVVTMPIMTRQSHERKVGLIEYAVSCAECGEEKKFWRYPGPAPKYCPECKEIIKRKKKKAYQDKWRSRRKKD